MQTLEQSYPELFPNPAYVEHIPGWQTILDTLCHAIRQHQDQQTDWITYLEGWNKNNLDHPLWPREVPEAIEPVVVEQIKEKFGGLRFYYSGGDQYIQGLVSLCELMSYKTCCYCGAPGKIRGNKRAFGWIYTACNSHTNPEDKDEY